MKLEYGTVSIKLLSSKLIFISQIQNVPKGRWKKKFEYDLQESK